MLPFAANSCNAKNDFGSVDEQLKLINQRDTITMSKNSPDTKQ